MPQLREVLFSESSTLGIRYRIERRVALPRKTVKVKTAFGTVRVKAVKKTGRGLVFAPEYDDCVKLASGKRVPLAVVRAAAVRAAERKSREVK
jgi:hypothetical protein